MVQVEMYDAAVVFWHDMRQALILALTATRTSVGAVWKQFWAAQQRFFRLLAVSMKVLGLGFCLCLCFCFLKTLKP